MKIVASDVRTYSKTRTHLSAYERALGLCKHADYRVSYILKNMNVDLTPTMSAMSSLSLSLSLSDFSYKFNCISYELKQEKNSLNIFIKSYNQNIK